MQSVKCKRLLAVLTAICILIMGMYSLTAGIDSSFVCAGQQNSQAVITTVQGCFDSQKMCTGEMLGLYRLDRSEAVCRFAGDKLTARVRGHICPVLSAIKKLPQNLLSEDFLAAVVQQGGSCSQAVILSYIHHQDGSKS